VFVRYDRPLQKLNQARTKEEEANESTMMGANVSFGLRSGYEASTNAKIHRGNHLPNLSLLVLSAEIGELIQWR
jgi:hypothetical protein